MPTLERILIIKMSAIGDVVQTLPFLEVLHHNLPNARIDWLVEEATADLVAGHPAVDRILVSRRSSWPRELARPATALPAAADIARFIARLRRRAYDLAIDLQGLLKSGLWLGLSRARRKVTLAGAREGSRWFATETPLPVDSDRHAIDRYLEAAERLGFRPVPWQGTIPISPGDLESADLLLAPLLETGRHIVALNPMARWESKLWPPERFAALADTLVRDFGCRLVFTGGHSDRPAIEKILRQMTAPALDLVGRTGLKELAALLTRATVLVCTDTGPMHMAVAMKCPVVALFGPTAPWRTGPYGPGHRVIRSKSSCSPCFRKTCPDDRCMRDITVAQVASAVGEVLSER